MPPSLPTSLCFLLFAIIVYAHHAATSVHGSSHPQWHPQQLSYHNKGQTPLQTKDFNSPEQEESRLNASFDPVWNPQHVSYDYHSQTLEITMDLNSTGARIQSKDKYLFGYISMDIKLNKGNTAGVVVAFYMSSLTDNIKDEIDFEFLGNVTGQPWAVQTNVFTNGTGGREQRVFLKFDPTDSFHSYSILWNTHQIVWYIDEDPVRVYPKIEGGLYPSEQPMWIFNSIWNGETWATRHGEDKIDWASAPFHASLNNSYRIDGCKWGNTYVNCAAAASWWNQSPSWTLNYTQQETYKLQKEKYLVYDYCSDASRNTTTSSLRECSANAPATAP